MSCSIEVVAISMPSLAHVSFDMDAGPGKKHQTVPAQWQKRSNPLKDDGEPASLRCGLAGRLLQCGTHNNANENVLLLHIRVHPVMQVPVRHLRQSRQSCFSNVCAIFATLM